MEKIRWGIMGPGTIAHSFAKGLLALPDAQIAAVASRSHSRAADFAGQYGIGRAYGSYEELARDPDVDIVYVATPHPMHKGCAFLCLQAGKAVLCEKSFTVNATDAAGLIAYARQSGLFLMEAMWTRFLPAVEKVRQWLAEGIIGEVRQVKADFGFLFDGHPAHRLLNPELGGGALLDVGIYPVSFASMIFGTQPSSITSLADIGLTGVDEQFAALFGYEGGKLAMLSGAVRTDTPQDAWILGTKGSVFIPDFWHAKALVLTLQGRAPEKYELPFEATGYNYEAAEAMRCLREGRTESAVMPLDETLTIMKTMDVIRKQWGLRYPCED
ncbi:Hypothetical protein LUCI_2925 [Lucifera butyrica]|uniref:Gfo/Idh/MocA-like oxidoreductase N-terminal domain-containing protein n=1 Tax=Lucifera butyrica TaxID=1351585 RepID=A0A498R9P2_9FIRM|nr:Gfo/Idh/MocA family oxidoreductase [Lucifera butyrica]VBB07660.1 Hypothetical protein LUCI_2925 [Lucifera butyrica]